MSTSRQGPAPATTTPLSAAAGRVLGIVARLGGSEGHVTIAEVAAKVGGHPNTSRQHLDSLLDRGLVSMELVNGTGVGRPPRSYALTPAGRRALATHREQADLLTAVAEHHRTAGDTEAAARSIGDIWGRRMASAQPRTGTPSSRILEVLDELGFSPVTRGKDLLLKTCPMIDAARDDPGFVCTMHQQMLSALADRFGLKDDITINPFSDPDGCRITFGRPAAG